MIRSIGFGLGSGFGSGRLTRPVAALLLLGSLLSACTSDDPFPSLDVTISGNLLPQIDPAEAQYVLWFSYPDDPTAEKGNAAAHSSALYVPVGEFVSDEQGRPVASEGGALGFRLPEGYNPQLIFDAIVTVEPAGPIPQEPSARLLAGPVTGNAAEGRADLTVGGADAFGSAFSDEAALKNAKYALLTPSTASSADENQGIWFLSGFSAGGLPVAPLPVSRDNDQWIYEAWVVRLADGERYRLGRFTDPDTTDSDGAGPFSGSTGAPLELPGSDFVEGTELILNSGEYGAVVALQPKDISLENPFWELFRIDTIGAGVETGVPLLFPYVRTEPVISISFSR